MTIVYILASRREKRYAEEFWIHTAALRRQVPTITWTEPLYIEDMVSSNAVVPTMAQLPLVIGCMSPMFVAFLLDKPALRELVQSASIRMPLIISPCAWNESPSPFKGLTPMNNQAVTSTSQRDQVFMEAVGKLRITVTRLSQEGR